jgi:hypothetical protein
MANTIKRLVLKSRLEAKTGLGTGTNTVYAAHFEAEDKGKQFYLLWGSGAPGTDYDTAPAGSMYFDYTNATVNIKKVASGWTAQV